MRRRIKLRGKRRAILWMLLTAGLGGTICVSCSNQSLDGMVVAVALAPGNGNSLESASLIAVDPDQPGETAKVISKKFNSACAPSVSHDGRYLLFSGKVKPEDPWQIWLMDLRRNSTSQITQLPEDCMDPAFLPEGRILFSSRASAKGGDITALFKCNRDGSELQQLTFHPHVDRASSILQDGRILYTSSQQFPEVTPPLFLVMRPDGTKSELFYRGERATFPTTRGTESEKGMVYFIESDSATGQGKPVAINQNRPLFSRIELSEGEKGDFHSVIPFGPSMCLVSYRENTGEPYAIRSLNVNDRQVGPALYQGEGDVIDPVWIRMMERPRKLPSEVNTNNPTGLLMSGDINHSMLPVNGAAIGDTAADRIQVWGLEGILGEVETAEDGSFYLKADADTPIRFLTLNRQGEVLRGPSDWIWLRPNERRGCVGCHANPEISPENRVPRAVKQPPVIVSSTQKEISKLEEPAK